MVNRLLLLYSFLFFSKAYSQEIGSISETVQLHQYLLSDSASKYSASIRALVTTEWINEPKKLDLFQIRPASAQLLFQHNQLHPYNWNDGALLPTSGNQQLISAGAEGKFKGFEFRIAPEFVLAQNDAYEGFPADHDPLTWRDYYRYYNFIETPERFGIFPVRKVYGGQSFIRYSYKQFSLEASTANKWWGPGQRNALLLSNNAPGIPHLSLKSNKPIESPLGTVEFEFLYGLNYNSPYPPADSSKVYRNYKLYVPKQDVQRLTKGFIFSWNPKWVPGLFLGLQQMDMRYLYETKRFAQWIPFQKPFRKVNKALDDKSLLLTSVFFKYQMPKAKMEIYGEFGWNNYYRNFRDFVVSPDRNMASAIGFRKLFPQPKGHYWEFNAELTNLQLPNVEDIFVNDEPKTWYLHQHVRQGYTHQGQILGAGTGPGGSSQFLEFNWRKKMNRLGFTLERKANNNDFYVYSFSNSFDFRRFWIDFAATAKADWKFGPVLVGARLCSIRSNNYQWWLFTPGNYYFVRGRDVNRWAGHLQLTYFFDKR